MGAASEYQHNKHKETQMRNALFVAFAAAVLSGCSMHYPQTREEFRQGIVSSDSSFKFVDTYVAKRRFEDVVGSLKQNVEACFDQDVTTTRTQGGMTTMNQTDKWRTTVRVINRNRAEVTTQMKMKGAMVSAKVPPGGFYVTAWTSSASRRRRQRSPTTAPRARGARRGGTS